jgi:hypothetical protein
VAENTAADARQALRPREERSCDRHLTQDEVEEDGRQTHVALPLAAFFCVSKKGGLLLANPLQSSRSTFSWGNLLSFFAFKDGMLDTPIALLGVPGVISGKFSVRETATKSLLSTGHDNI